MRTSLARSRLRNNEPVRIACMYYPNAMMPAHAAKAGYDAIWLDAEHNTWDRRELQRMIALHHLANIDCIVRTGSRNATDLYHLLEMGATGLMIPLVNTAAEAAALVQAVKFPPLGQRGLDGAGIDNDFYLDGTATYPAAANRETLLIVQIETPAGARKHRCHRRDEGRGRPLHRPGRPSAALGLPARLGESQAGRRRGRRGRRRRRHQIAWGRPGGGPAQIKRIAAKGGKLIAHGSDFGALMSMLPTYAKAFNEAIPGRNNAATPRHHEA
jgi:4-hydroxy-2-oxoheptanedioate aldolase